MLGKSRSGCVRVKRHRDKLMIFRQQKYFRHGKLTVRTPGVQEAGDECQKQVGRFRHQAINQRGGTDEKKAATPWAAAASDLQRSGP